MIHVSSLSALSSVTARLHSYDLPTLLSPDYPETDWSGFACDRHVRLAFHDIAEPKPGLTAPDRDMMQTVLDFGRNGGRQRALLIHCWAGISRPHLWSGCFCHCMRSQSEIRTRHRHRTAPAGTVRHAQPADGQACG